VAACDGKADRRRDGSLFFSSHQPSAISP
jgi:hypothetical protein